MGFIHNLKPALLYFIIVNLLFLRSPRNWREGNQILFATLKFIGQNFRLIMGSKNHYMSKKKKDTRVHDFDELKIFFYILTNISHIKILIYTLYKCFSCFYLKLFLDLNMIIIWICSGKKILLATLLMGQKKNQQKTTLDKFIFLLNYIINELLFNANWLN